VKKILKHISNQIRQLERDITEAEETNRLMDKIGTSSVVKLFNVDVIKLAL
jgi:hypothetical protein